MKRAYKYLPPGELLKFMRVPYDTFESIQFNHMKATLFLIIILLTFNLSINVWATESRSVNDPPFILLQQDLWVQNILDSLTLEEKIAQLIMIPVFPRQTDTDKSKIIRTIQEYKPGGI